MTMGTMGANDRFFHDYVRNNGNLVKSTCSLCGALVGAAADPFILQLLEEAHSCHANAQAG
ncbi:MAG TPA: hypothetical protein VFA60_07305 [Terriglobales bacterium]|nr:hypothetical protein [Terriglobales bacterium]